MPEEDKHFLLMRDAFFENHIPNAREFLTRPISGLPAVAENS
jgi:hypothetical protein